MADVVYLVRDMLFSSKIREVGKQLGVTSQSAPDPAALARAARGARLVVLDLRDGRSLEALDAIRSEPALAAVRCVGFVDHEKTDVMEEARARGCDQVLTKGQFSKVLPQLLAFT
jgi:CheY-like chemotaxis protein